jgi:hypothetical protein
MVGGTSIRSWGVLAAIASCLGVICFGASAAAAATVSEYTSQGEVTRIDITAGRVTFKHLPVVFRCASGYQTLLYDDGTYLNRSGAQVAPLIGSNKSDHYRLTGRIAKGVFVGRLTESYDPRGYRGPCTASVGFGNGFYYVPEFKTKFVIGAGLTSAPLKALIMYAGLRFEASDTYWSECYHCTGSNAGSVRPKGGSTIRFDFPHPPIINDHSTLLIGRSGPGSVGRFRTYRFSVYSRKLTPLRTFCTPPAITAGQLYNDVFPSSKRRAVPVSCPH